MSQVDIGRPVLPAQPTGTPGTDVAAAYIAAWNRHDGAAVADAVSGTYHDPTLPEPIRGEELASYVEALVAAIPDLHFEPVGEPLVVGNHLVLRWRMQGTNSAQPLPGAPFPTHGTCDLPGVDVITFEDDRIVDVVGYFDQKTFVEQLGLQTFAMPKDEWPVSAGTALRVDLGYQVTPGALSLTWIDLEDDAEQAELIERSQQIVMALASEPGFLGWMGTTIGRRNATVTLWTSPEAAEHAISRSAPHAEAMNRVHQQGFGRAGFTGIWQAYRLNEQHVRCNCGAWVGITSGETTGTCGCGLGVEATQYI